ATGAPGRAGGGRGRGTPAASAAEAVAPAPTGAVLYPRDGAVGDRGGARGARQLRRRLVRPDRRLGDQDVRPVEPWPRTRIGGVARRRARLTRRDGSGRPAGAPATAPRLLRGRGRHQCDLGGPPPPPRPCPPARAPPVLS